jgi:hypothetical protein
MFDIVIPLGPNDAENIEKQISCTKQHVLGYRNIYIVKAPSVPSTVGHNASLTPLQIHIDDCIIIDESIFEFADQIAVYHNKDKRNGWYLQQLIKLYAGFVIPGILDRYLVIDADTFFLNPTRFINSENQCLYNFSREYHKYYFEHMLRLHPEFTRVYELSGICHHMMFETRILREMMEKVVQESSGGDPFWVIFLEKVEPWLRHGIGSGASEYELYFNYVCKFHMDEIEIRELQWENVKCLDLEKYPDKDYISNHHFMRS